MQYFILLTLAVIQLSFSLINVNHIYHNRQLRYGASVADRSDSPEIDKTIIYKSDESLKLKDQILLPSLSSMEMASLRSNQRVQCQKRVGREGYGWVVLDVKAAPDRVFQALRSFDRYQEMIPTVRSAKILTLNDKTAIAEYSLSRFRLPVNVIQSVDIEQGLIRFDLDPARPNPVISKVEGYWCVKECDDRDGYTRVWLYANVVASRLLPSFIVDYAASRALPRATEWLKTYNFMEQQQ